MASGIIVAIRTKPYLKDWIINHYGKGSTPVKASSSSKLFPLFFQFLTHKPKDWRPPVEDAEHLLFELPYHEVINVRTRCYIDEDHFTFINSYFYGIFYTHFTTWMNSKCLDQRNKWAFKYAIFKYMDECDISIDKINYDSLKRIYLRYRKQFADFNENDFDERPKKKHKKVNQKMRQKSSYSALI